MDTEAPSECPTTMTLSCSVRSERTRSATVSLHSAWRRLGSVMISGPKPGNSGASTSQPAPVSTEARGRMSAGVPGEAVHEERGAAHGAAGGLPERLVLVVGEEREAAEER